MTPLDIAPADIQRLMSQVAPEGRLRLNPETVEQDLARLVLGLMEFLRQLMELQAIRQVERGELSAEQEEKLGLTLMRAEAALHDLAARFGLRPEDLSLDLGPLGRTV
jgi:hypothetical protein